MGRKTETDEQKVKKVYPDAKVSHVLTDKKIGIEYISISDWSTGNVLSNSHHIQNTDLAWSDALRQINAAKRKKYYKRKITRPNNEKKGKVNIMLYPSDKTAIIGKYGSVQKFINHSVEQIKTK